MVHLCTQLGGDCSNNFLLGRMGWDGLYTTISSMKFHV